MTELLLFLGVLVTALALSARWAYKREMRLWNKGYCPHCLTVWKSFDMDSQGGRGYCCCCKPNRYIWISYPIEGI